MAWIRTVPFEQASGRLRQLYQRIKGADNNVDNIMLAHSLRPHTMEGHMALYKQVLHHSANSLPKWFLETIGVWVSSLNDCGYCVEHHYAGLCRLLDDAPRASAIRAAIDARDPAAAPLPPGYAQALVYARLLSETPGRVGEAQIDALREAGFDDGQILEINQVTAYFAYANRTVLGLGCSIEGDIVGLSPGNSADPDDWRHA